MLSKLTDLSLLKEKFIQERKNILASDVSALQKKLYTKLFDKLIAVLDIEGGSIINNNANISATSAVDKVFKDFETDLSKTMQGVTNDYSKLIGYNEKYFAEFNAYTFASVKIRVINQMQARAGFSSKGFEKDGFVDSFIKDKAIARSVKQAVLGAVLNGTPLKELSKSLSATINGTDKSPGALENHFRTYVYDTYSQFDRETSNQFSIGLDLNYAIYAGGLVDASREFCIVRNGKAFTREEIHAFGTPQDKFGGYTNKSKGEFTGKNKDYIPERDLGGYNCGHIPNWVTYAIAKTKRPDIQKSIYDKQKAAA